MRWRRSLRNFGGSQGRPLAVPGLAEDAAVSRVQSDLFGDALLAFGTPFNLIVIGVVLFNANVTLLGNYACYRQPVEDLALRLLFPSIHLESSFAEAASFVHFRSSKHPCCAKLGHDDVAGDEQV